MPSSRVFLSGEGARGPAGADGPVGPRGLDGPEGPAGYNATGAAEDAQALADFTNQTAGPNPFATSLAATLVPRVINPATSTTITRLLKIDPAETAVAPFEIVSKQFANGGGKPANVGTWIGYNASRYLQQAGQNGEADRLGWHMGLESGYHNTDDGTFGPEWYLNYTSPDNNAVKVAQFRPLYVRLGEGDTNSALDKWAHVTVDIGVTSEGIFGVGAGNPVDGKTLFYVKKTETMLSSDNVVAQGQTFAVRPEAQGIANATAVMFVDSKGTSPAVIALRVGAADGWTLQSDTTNDLHINDRVGQTVMAFSYGATEATRFAQFLSNVNVSKVLAVNGAATLKGLVYLGTTTSAPTLTATDNLGTSRPAPTLAAGSNSMRGTIRFGTGTAPAAGDLITVVLPNAFENMPIPTVQAANFASGGKAWFVRPVSADTFVIGNTGTLAASQAADTFQLNYQLIG